MFWKTLILVNGYTYFLSDTNIYTYGLVMSLSLGNSQKTLFFIWQSDWSNFHSHVLFLQTIHSILINIWINFHKLCAIPTTDEFNLINWCFFNILFPHKQILWCKQRSSNFHYQQSNTVLPGHLLVAHDDSEFILTSVA